MPPYISFRLASILVLACEVPHKRRRELGRKLQTSDLVAAYAKRTLLNLPTVETAMSTEKKTEAPKQQPKPSIPDALLKTNKTNVELTEEELKRATGGCDAGSKDAFKIV